MSEPDWIHEGATVAERTGRGASDSVTISTIERLTKTQIVLANGRRYNRASRHLVGDHYAGELLSPTDGWVLSTLANKQVERLAHRVHLINRARKGGLGGALAALDEIDALTRSAREAIDKLRSA